MTASWFVGTPLGGALAFSGGPAPGSLNLERGVAIGAGVSWPLWTTYDRPFALDLTAQLASSFTTLEPEGGGPDGDALAVDVRVTATASRTFDRNLALWGAVRAFGGPLFVRRGGGAEPLVASDTRHVQLAAGLSLAPLQTVLPQLRLTLEGRALSEWGLSAALGWSL